VLRSRSQYCSLPPRPICQCVDAEVSSVADHRWDIWFAGSISVGVGHPRWRRPHVFSPNFTSSSDWFTVTSSVLCRTAHSIPRVLNRLSCGLKFNFIGSLLQKPPASAMTSADWFTLPWRQTPRLTSDARSIQISQSNKAKLSEQVSIKELHRWV